MRDPLDTDSANTSLHQVYRHIDTHFMSMGSPMQAPLPPKEKYLNTDSRSKSLLYGRFSYTYSYSATPPIIYY